MNRGDLGWIPAEALVWPLGGPQFKRFSTPNICLILGEQKGIYHMPGHIRTLFHGIQYYVSERNLYKIDN